MGFIQFEYIFTISSHWRQYCSRCKGEEIFFLKKDGLNQFIRQVIKSKQVSDIQWIFKQHFASNSFWSIQGNIAFLTRSIVWLMQQLAAAKLMHVFSAFHCAGLNIPLDMLKMQTQTQQKKKHCMWRQCLLSINATVNLAAAHGLNNVQLM